MPTVQPAHSPTLHLQVADTGERLDLVADRLIVAGYTGRDVAAVRAHIEELAAIGVPAPPTVPTFYDLDPALLTTDPIIEVTGGNTSGEVEPVLIRHNGRFFLGVGSDHTDRDLERGDITASKAACAKPLSERVIPLPADLESVDWDRIGASSSVDDQQYQRGTLAALRTPADLIAKLTSAVKDLDGDMVVFAGTLPLLAGRFVPGTKWRLTMNTSEGTTLTRSYEVKRRSA
ncbi:MAG: DUF2848 family protein [Sciscionella sp.]